MPARWKRCVPRDFPQEGAMFYRKEKTWIERAGIFNRRPGRFLKKEMRNWMAINLLLWGLGRIGEIPAVRRRVMKLGLSRLGAVIDSGVGSRLFGWRRAGAGSSPAMTACASLGAGVGLMYLFDPDRGACRRARLKDKAAHAINKTGAAAGSVSRDLTNRVRGLAAQAGSAFKSGDADDDTLAARVRSRMGRAVSHPGAIDVTAYDGVVTLRGDALTHELDTLLSCARSTPGVRGVDNQLQIHNRPGDIPNLQGGPARGALRVDAEQLGARDQAPGRPDRRRADGPVFAPQRRARPRRRDARIRIDGAGSHEPRNATHPGNRRRAARDRFSKDDQYRCARRTRL